MYFANSDYLEKLYHICNIIHQKLANKCLLPKIYTPYYKSQPVLDNDVLGFIVKGIIMHVSDTILLVKMVKGFLNDIFLSVVNSVTEFIPNAIDNNIAKLGFLKLHI